MELPPRARRILDVVHNSVDEIGTTSACAENTLAELNLSETERNYLRVRGEYDRYQGTLPQELELPPRARRILNPLGLQIIHGGTTSACAENTRGHFLGVE